MQIPKCPGQDRRYWKPEDIYEDECPDCGNILEFWKTDIRIRCEKCGRLVSNPRFDLGCAAWCPYAEYCLGDVAKGYGKPDSFLEKIETEMEYILKGEALDRIKRVLPVAEKLSEERGADLLVIVVAACFWIIKEYMDEKTAKKAIAEFPDKAGLPRLVVEEASQVLAELEGGNLKSLSARMLHKALKVAAQSDAGQVKEVQGV
ncbi:MAG: hypothetical protein GX996_08360 [Firmicutes bacterium]|mgnify:CR=1 FL=1|nr:hypothetical protein [Bacillota bacterium]